MKNDKNKGNSSKAIFLKTVVITTVCLLVAVIIFLAIGFFTGRLG